MSKASIAPLPSQTQRLLLSFLFCGVTEDIKADVFMIRYSHSQLRWFSYVKRMDEHRIPKRLLELKMTGKDPGADHVHG
jgi:hypothetical protein